MAKLRKRGGNKEGDKPGQKKPFTMEQVQLIRAALKAKGDIRGLALFEAGIATVLRSCDLLKLRVKDVLSEGKIITSFTVHQQKTHRDVRVSLSTAAEAALLAYIAADQKAADERLWPITRVRYGQIVKGWARLAFLDPRFYNTHSIRRTVPTYIHKMTGSHEIPRKLLGHAGLVQTARYLGVDDDDAHETKRKYEM